MASSKDYLMYALDLLREVEDVSYRKMMGEYILYKDVVIFGGIYDNRFLIKKCDLLNDKGLKEAIPYPSAKPMLLEDVDEIKELVMLACKKCM